MPFLLELLRSKAARIWKHGNVGNVLPALSFNSMDRDKLSNLWGKKQTIEKFNQESESVTFTFGYQMEV